MNQYDLNGRVALITGGGSGLGRGIGQALAELGAIVVAADIQTEPAEEAASALRQQGHQAMAVKMDVTDPASDHRYGSRFVSVRAFGYSGQQRRHHQDAKH